MSSTGTGRRGAQVAAVAYWFSPPSVAMAAMRSAIWQASAAPGFASAGEHARGLAVAQPVIAIDHVGSATKAAARRFVPVFMRRS